MQPSFELVVCIASTVLFDCRESHEIWTREGIESYKKHQREHVNVPLKPGVGFPLVQSLLELNKVVDKPLIDVVLVSRNDTESAQRIIQSINYYNLPITRMSFTSSTDVTKYLPAWKCDLFLSTEEAQVREVLECATPGIFEGIAAGLVYNIITEPVPVQPNSMSAENDAIVSNMTFGSHILAPWPKEQVRIVFDGDGVLFSKTEPPIFQQSDQERVHPSLSKGPMQTFALKLENVRRALGKTDGWRVRTFLVIARNNENTQRVFSTLREWGLDIDETHILGGLDMTPFLRVTDPAIFFDNSMQHIECAEQHIPAAHVPFDARNKRAITDPALLEIPQPIEKAEQNHIDGDNNELERFESQTFQKLMEYRSNE